MFRRCTVLTFCFTVPCSFTTMEFDDVLLRRLLFCPSLFWRRVVLTSCCFHIAVSSGVIMSWAVMMTVVGNTYTEYFHGRLIFLTKITFLTITHYFGFCHRLVRIPQLCTFPRKQDMTSQWGKTTERHEWTFNTGLSRPKRDVWSSSLRHTTVIS